MCVCVCVCACICVRACDVLCAHVYTICGTSLYRPKERPELSVALNLILDILLQLYDDIRRKETNEKRICEFFLPVDTVEGLFFFLFLICFCVGIREVHTGKGL